MTKSISYYDWELSFKKKKDDDEPIEEIKVNSLGVDENTFKEFMKKWKENNL